MRLIFAGTPPFAATALDALVGAGHTVALVLTQPDRPSGRGMRLTESAVAKTAAKYSLRVEKPASLKSTEAQSMLRHQQSDVMVVVAYGLLLPAAALEVPKWGCLNIHASLLPRWRGAAPIQRAIEAGDALTGITIMQMDEGLDTGAVLAEKQLPIDPNDSSASLFEKLASLGAQTIVETLAKYHQLKAVPQVEDGVTYAKKILKSEARLDWTQSAMELERRMRAFDPFPGCECIFENEPLKIWRSTMIDADLRGAHAGTVVSVEEKELVIQCGKGQLRIDMVQRPGGRRLPIGEFLRSANIKPGMVFL